MATQSGQNVKRDIERRYLQRTAKTREHLETAKKYLPGGDTRSAAYYGPYPVFMEKGQGCYLTDCDGNEYVDLVNNFTSLIHGHAHPRLVEAARAQSEKGTAFAAPAVIQYQHARHLCDRVSSLDQVRYCNSGTEATLFAMRAARAFTGKDGFIKMDGGYHGVHDFVEANTLADFGAEGLPSVHLERGVPARVAEDLYIAPFNDLEATESILKQHCDRIAGIIMEPMLGSGGLLYPRPGYLEGMRELADRYRVLLVFDEVMTFRLSRGGLQEHEGVRPDLTALGKLIGGGYPVGAFGGRSEIMGRFDPNHPESIAHSGTFGGNNNTLAAGLVALEMYGQEQADRINGLGDRLRSGFQAAMERVGVRGQAGGWGSLVGTIWTGRELNNAKDVVLGFLDSGDISAVLHWEMLNRGVFFSARGMYVISTPMDEAVIDKVVGEFEGALQVIRPYVAETRPELVTK
jgi:glutamate-1-semialdehyde 2,1-aminomutase